MKHSEQNITGFGRIRLQQKRIRMPNTIDAEILELGVSLPQLALCKKYLTFVLDNNHRARLTAITDPEEAMRLHLYDSLSILPEVNAAPKGTLLDIGTGGGFPGVPIGIVTGRPVTLMDSVKKKVRLVEEGLQELGIQSTFSTSDIRAEEIAATNRNSYSLITARALSSLPSLIELAQPLLKVGGVLIALKGTITAEEVAAGDKAAKLLGFKRTDWRQFKLPHGDEQRSVLVYKKSREGSMKLPRRPGMAQRRPLA